MKTKLLILFPLLFFKMNAAGAANLVYGEGFSFSIDHPKGWTCECDGKNAAAVGANILLHRQDQTFNNAQPLIYILVNKRGKSPQHDLDTDIKSTKVEKPKTKFEKLAMDSVDGPTASSVFLLPQGVSEYVTYYFPKKSNANSLSITMHFDHRTANREEMKAFKETVKSIHWLADVTNITLPGKK